MNITITFNGKTKDYEQLVPGIVRSGSNYLLFDKAFNTWKYINQARLDTLAKKYKGLEKLGANYESKSPGAVHRALRKQNEPKPSKPVIDNTSKPIVNNDLQSKTSSGMWIHRDYRFPGQLFQGKSSHVLDTKIRE
jgi:hypothetical protein